MNVSFKPSINIKYDFKTNDLLDYYIPTPTHIDVINSICESISQQKSYNNQLIVGAYGTGKSLLGLLITSLLSKRFTKKEFHDLSLSFAKCDETITLNLKKIQQLETDFIPVFISGDEGDFHKAILINTLNSLKERGIFIKLNSSSTEILDTLKIWENEYPLTYEEFIFILKSNNMSEKKFKDQVSSFDESAYKLFETAYTQLTSGAKFNYFNHDNFISQLEQIFEQLDAQGYGIVYIYDEFGRFLQTLSLEKVYTTMQNIQDFTELIDHGVSNIRSVLIAHKDIQYYFTDKNLFIDEFQRIEKRFKKHYISSNRDIFFSFAEKMISNLRSNKVNNASYVQEQLNYLRKYSLYTLNRIELEEVLIKGCYPMHPVTIALLQPLSNAFGQNERTLFSFLDTSDTFGLKNHLKTVDGVYYAWKLFDFFFPNIQDPLYLDSTYGQLRNYIKNYTRISTTLEPDDYQKMLNVMKFITIWQITGQHTVQSLTNEFISYSTGYTIEEIKEILVQLKDYKILRYNRMWEQWEIYEGSSVDLEQKITEQISSIKLTTYEKCNALQNFLDKKFFTADRYNLEKKMTRFAEVKVLSWESLLDENSNLLDSDADAVINLVLSNFTYKKEIIAKIKSIQSSDFTNLFCLIDKSIEEFDDEILRYEALVFLSNDSKLLFEDNLLKSELKIEIEEVLHQLQQKVIYLTSFNERFDWFVATDELKFMNELQLKNYLSELFSTQFPETPVINNEVFNRRNIAGVQKTSAKKVIDAILNAPMEDHFGIDGFGPDYLIYATVFKNNGIESARDLPNINETPLAKLRDQLTSVLRNTNKFSELVNVLRLKPYALREPVIPVLLVGLLQEDWSNIMFYNNGQYISKITSNEIYAMIENDKKITYQINEFNVEDVEFFEMIVELFNTNLSEYVIDKPLNIQASSALLGWLQSLPKFTQVSNIQSDELLLFKRHIRRLEINPNEALEWLRANESEILSYKRRLESWFLEHIEIIFEALENKLNVGNIYEWAIMKSKQIKDNQFLAKILACHTESHISFLNELSTQLFEYPITDWTDSLSETFIREIENQVKIINQIKFDPEVHYELKINDEVRYVLKSELTPRAKSLYDNLKRMIDNTGKRITNAELEYILYSIIQEKLTK